MHKSNKKDNAIIKGDSGTKSLVVYFSQADVVDLDMVEWFVKMVEERKKNNRSEKETKNW